MNLIFFFSHSCFPNETMRPHSMKVLSKTYKLFCVRINNFLKVPTNISIIIGLHLGAGGSRGWLWKWWTWWSNSLGQLSFKKSTTIKNLSMIYVFIIKKNFQAYFFCEFLIVKQTQHGFRLQNLLRQTQANLTFFRSSITFNSWARCPTLYTSIQYTEKKAGIWSVTGVSEIT